MQSENTEASFEPVRWFTLSPTVRPLAIPTAVEQNKVLHIVSLNTLQDAAVACTPPQRSYPGFWLEGQSDEQLFPAVEAFHSSGLAMKIGTAIETSEPVMLSQKNMLGHMLVAGGAGSGKTTTIKTLLLDAYKKGVSFLVIEGAKKEYAALKSVVPSLKVYGSGIDSLPLRVNPLEPEIMTPVSEHITAVTAALCAASGGEHPLPEVLEGVLEYTYLQKGWRCSDIAHFDSHRPWPTLQESLANVDVWMQKNGQYGPEVKQNITAAAKMRLRKLCTGTFAALFSQRTGLTAKDLTSGPVVLEMSDFSGQTAAFLSTVLLFRLQRYFMQQEETHELKQIVVVEEAHTTFSKTSDETGISASNNRLLEKLLAEVRAFGVSILISDQRPSALAEGIPALTRVKLVHALDGAQDRSLMADSMNMNERQRREILNLQEGESMLAVRGERGLIHLKIDPPVTNHDFSAACLLCSSGTRCRRNIVDPLLDRVSIAELYELSACIAASSLDGACIASAMDRLLDKCGVKASVSVRLCLLGLPYNNDGVYGSHNYEHGKTEIELIKALPSTMRLTAIHEYEHVASYHNEIVEKHHNSTLHTVQVGLRTKEYIVDRDGERLLYRNEGENLNEGLTQYLTEDKLSAEELSMAQAMRIYPFATEAAASLSDILGSASIREDFYEGTSHIRDALDETLGQGTFQRFCSCLDQASESPESDQRREAMREANKILNTLAARKAAEKQNKEA